jgi:hypothetical protein
MLRDGLVRINLVYLYESIQTAGLPAGADHMDTLVEIR